MTQKSLKLLSGSLLAAALATFALPADSFAVGKCVSGDGTSTCVCTNGCTSGSDWCKCNGDDFAF